MIVAFLGKGGSGKSTMATALVNELQIRGTKVLAIDADHNMDFSYNLGIESSLFLGSDPEYIKEYITGNRSGKYVDLLSLAKKQHVVFSAFPPDPYTEKISTKINDSLRLITAGPHTERVRSQEACSHSLAAPLKVYLPLLKLSQNEVVVIDERAGTDPVATGILQGVNLSVIVREPTVNSQRVAKQIQFELEIAKVPHIIIENKIDGIEKDTQRASKEIFNSTNWNVAST